MRYVYLLLLLAFCDGSTLAEEHAHKGSRSGPQSSEYAEFTQKTQAGMEKMMHDMHAYVGTGDVDADFLSMMVPHHEGAVEMARLVLIYGQDPLTRRLAEEIIASQQVEIEAMKRRLAILRSRKDPGTEEFPALGGTRGRVNDKDGKWQ